MSNISRRKELDADLDRLVQTTGRVPLGAAVVTFTGAGLVWGIGKLAGADPSIFDYAAGLIVGCVVCPALVLMALDQRERMLAHAEEKPLERNERKALPRGRRPTTDKYAMLPYGSPAGCPLPSVKSGFRTPERDPSVITLCHPVPVMLVPDTPSGISTSLTSTFNTPCISPAPSSTSIRVRFPSFRANTTGG